MMRLISPIRSSPQPPGTLLADFLSPGAPRTPFLARAPPVARARAVRLLLSPRTTTPRPPGSAYGHTGPGRLRGSGDDGVAAPRAVCPDAFPPPPSYTRTTRRVAHRKLSIPEPLCICIPSLTPDPYSIHTIFFFSVLAAGCASEPRRTRGTRARLRGMGGRCQGGRGPSNFGVTLARKVELGRDKMVWVFIGGRLRSGPSAKKHKNT